MTEPEVRGISPASLVWRVLAAVALVVLLLNGSIRESDDVWPFSPMSQYDFRPPANDTVRITRVIGTLATGQELELPLRVETAGISRAEIEAKIPDFRRDPSLLRAVSDGWTARHPDEPALRRLDLVQDETHLEEGRAVSTDRVVLVSWTVSA